MTWIDYTRGEVCWQIINIICDGFKKYTEKYIGKPSVKLMHLWNGEHICYRIDKEEGDILTNHVVEQTKDKNYFDKLLKNYKELLGNIRKLSEELRKKDISKLSDKELSDIQKELVDTFLPYSGITSQHIDFMDLKLEELMIAKLKGLMMIKLGEDYSESLLVQEYSVLTTPDELSFVNQEEIMMYELAEEDSKEAAKKIVSKFWWVPLGWARTNARTVKDVIERLSNVKRPGEKIIGIKTRLKLAREKKKALADIYTFDDEMNHLMHLFEEYVVLHDYRKEGQMRTLYFLFKINDETGKRNSIDGKLLDYASPAEVKDLILNHKIDIKELKSRKKAIFFHSKSIKEEEFYSGDKALQMIEEELKVEHENIESFSGIAASSGIVAGKAKICTGVKDARAKMEEGDILITGMTTPDFVPFMCKAAAIVTNEGGATSHAAVISREFGIPCIVGTRIATKFVKDDELIEVDANNNIVRIIKNE